MHIPPESSAPHTALHVEVFGSPPASATPPEVARGVAADDSHHLLGVFAESMEDEDTELLFEEAAAHTELSAPQPAHRFRTAAELLEGLEDRSAGQGSRHATPVPGIWADEGTQATAMTESTDVIGACAVPEVVFADDDEARPTTAAACLPGSAAEYVGRALTADVGRAVSSTGSQPNNAHTSSMSSRAHRAAPIGCCWTALYSWVKRAGSRGLQRVLACRNLQKQQPWMPMIRQLGAGWLRAALQELTWRTTTWSMQMTGLGTLAAQLHALSAAQCMQQ